MDYTVTLHWAIHLVNTADGSYDIDEYAEVFGLTPEEIIAGASEVTEITLDDEHNRYYGINEEFNY